MKMLQLSITGKFRKSLNVSRRKIGQSRLSTRTGVCYIDFYNFRLKNVNSNGISVMGSLVIFSLARLKDY